MADNTVLNAGTGGDTIATDDISGTKHQLVKVEFGAADSATQVSSANPLPVVQTGTPGLPTGAATAAKQPALGTAGAASADVITVQGVASMTAVKVDGSGVTQPVSGTITASGPLTDTQLRASAVPVSGTVTSTLGATTNAGATAKTSDYDTGAGTDTVTSFGIALPASGGAVQGGTSTNPVRTDPTGTTTQPVSGTVTATGPLTDTQLRASAVPVSLASAPSTAVTNAGTFAVQIAANSSVNQAQVAGTTTDTNSGNKSAGTQRVVLATDQPQLTNALKVDGSAVTQPVSGTVTTNQAAAAGATGYSRSHTVSAASTNATNVKASAGKLHGWYIYNSNAAARKVAFHNTAGTPTAGSGVVDSLVIPPNSAANAFTDVGIAFSTGIAFTTVTDLTDAGTTAVGASDLIINLYYI